jgi:hypothetical protein
MEYAAPHDYHRPRGDYGPSRSEYGSQRIDYDQAYRSDFFEYDRKPPMGMYYQHQHHPKHEPREMSMQMPQEPMSQMSHPIVGQVYRAQERSMEPAGQLTTKGGRKGGRLLHTPPPDGWLRCSVKLDSDGNHICGWKRQVRGRHRSDGSMSRSDGGADDELDLMHTYHLLCR